MGIPPIAGGSNQPNILTDDVELSLIEQLPIEVLNVIFSQSGFSCASLAETNFSFRELVLGTSHLKIHHLAAKFIGLGFQAAEALPPSSQRTLLMTNSALFLAPCNPEKAKKALRRTVRATESTTTTARKKKQHEMKAAQLADIALSSLPLDPLLAREILKKAQDEAMQSKNRLNRALALGRVAETAGAIDPSIQRHMADLALQEIQKMQVVGELLKPLFGTLVQYEPVKVMKTIGLHKDPAGRAQLLEHVLHKVSNTAFLEILPLALSIAASVSNEEGDEGLLEGDQALGHDALMGQIVTRLAPLNADAAIDIAKSDGQSIDYLISCIVQAIAKTSFDQALVLAKSINDAALRLEALQKVMLSLTSENCLKACVVATQLNNEQIDHDLTMAIIRSEANNHPALALARADEIRDPTQRERAFVSLFDQWTEGQNQTIFSHLHELKIWMNKSRQALKIIKAFPGLGDTDLKELLNMIKTPLENIEAQMVVAKILEPSNLQRSSDHALASMKQILEIPPQSSLMLDQLKSVIADFARMQPAQTVTILREAKEKRYHEKLVAYLLLFIAEARPSEALDYMKDLVWAPQLRHEIMVAVAKGIAARGKPQDVALIDTLLNLIHSEPLSASKVELYLSIAEALTNTRPITAS
ncbi:hypothetical protein [Estrella lausannensis]|uniref:Uncharacterized protein n=1 Tax=Estrella lausannensis TaxID=483423 RepID=A0A0H5DNN3_9BACT|nr:hypothetical protein [Estrella lausannensis]CRX37981.1 hypothetical protein ELAC_0627 [Estrella lausannensis]